MGKRIITLLVGIVLFTLVFFLDSLQLVKGPLFFNISLVICSFLMCHELYKALEEKGFKPVKLLGYLCTLFVLPIGVIQTRTLMITCVVMIPLVFLIGMSISVFSKLKYNVVDIAITLLGNVYTVFMVSFLSATRTLPLGVFLIFYTICGAWFSDIFAYIFGRLFGKHKFSTISPKKSIEGCVAGLFGTVFFFIVYSIILGNMNVASANVQNILENSIDISIDSETYKDESSLDISTDTLGVNLDMVDKNNLKYSSDYDMHQRLKKHFFNNYVLLILLGVLISVISQIGDLAASGIKRYCGIKDFSNLMPGHGGMLDRFDSVLLISPIMYLVFYAIAII